MKSFLGHIYKYLVIKNAGAECYADEENREEINYNWLNSALLAAQNKEAMAATNTAMKYYLLALYLIVSNK